MKRSRLISCFFILLSCYCASQNCYTDTASTQFERLFGSDRLLVDGKDTLLAAHERVLIYSCSDCSVICTKKGKVTWKKSLQNKDCRLICFAHMPVKPSRKTKHCDVLLQLNNKEVYGLASRNGRMKRIGDKKFSRRISKK